MSFSCQFFFLNQWGCTHFDHAVDVFLGRASFALVVSVFLEVARITRFWFVLYFVEGGANDFSFQNGHQAGAVKESFNCQLFQFIYSFWLCLHWKKELNFGNVTFAVDLPAIGRPWQPTRPGSTSPSSGQEPLLISLQLS